jgi:hypothetical protein
MEYKKRQPEHHCVLQIFKGNNMLNSGKWYVTLNGRPYPDDKTYLPSLGAAVCRWAQEKYGERLSQMDGYFRIMRGYLSQKHFRAPFDGFSSEDEYQIGQILYEAFGFYYWGGSFSYGNIFIIMEYPNALCFKNN